MAFSMQGGGALNSEINITPMIDVLLVLLVIFMLVVVMSDEKGLKAEIPQPADTKTETAKADPAVIVIQIAFAGDNQRPTLKINNEDVKWNGLHDRLTDIFKERAVHVAYVKGDDEVDFQYVADAISIARESGVDKIGLLTRTGPESP